MTPEQEAHRDGLIKRVKHFLVLTEDMTDEINAAAAEDPKAWTEFDRNRNVMALKTCQHMLEDMVERLLLQVGRWEEINQPGVTWEQVKARIHARSKPLPRK